MHWQAQGWNLTTKAWTLAGMMTIPTVYPRECPWICRVWGSALWNSNQVLVYVWHDSQVMILTLSKLSVWKRLNYSFPLWWSTQACNRNSTVRAEGRLRQIRVSKSPKLIPPTPPLPGEVLAWQTVQSHHILVFWARCPLTVFVRKIRRRIKIPCNWPAWHLLVLSPVLFRTVQQW